MVCGSKEVDRSLLNSRLRRIYKTVSLPPLPLSVVSEHQWKLPHSSLILRSSLDKARVYTSPTAALSVISLMNSKVHKDGEMALWIEMLTTQA